MNFYKVTLKSWLYEKICQNHAANGQEYLGLEWIDEEQLTFKIPWVTTRHPNWQRYYKLFHDWASRDGKESTDAQKAKRNFRTVLEHATNHFRHIKEEDKQLQTESYKVYQFIKLDQTKQDDPPRGCSRESSSSPESFMSEGSRFNAQYTITTNERSTPNGYYAGANMLQQQQLVCSPMNTEHEQMLLQHDIGVYTGSPHNQESPEYQLANHMQLTASDQPDFVAESTDDDMSGLMYTHLDSLQLARQKLNEVGITEVNEASCTVSIEYNGAQQSFSQVSLRTPCRIAYRNSTNLQNDQFNTLFLEPVDHNKYPGLNTILENVKGGLLFWYDPRTLSFYMKRECLVQVYSFNMHDKSESEHPLTLKKTRTDPYCMFSFKQYVNEWVPRRVDPDAQNSMLSHRIEFILGVKPGPDKRGKPVKGVKITIQPLGADLIANCEDPLLQEEVITSISSLPDLGQNVFDGILNEGI